MVLTARKGLRLAESQASATWDYGSGSDPDERPRRISLRRGHLWITRTPKRRTPRIDLFDLHQPSKPIVRYHHSVGGARAAASSRGNQEKSYQRTAVPDEHQPGCFALEEERGGNWKGSGGTVPSVKEAKPSL